MADNKHHIRRSWRQEEGCGIELRPVQRGRPEIAGVPIFEATPEEWVKRVSRAYDKVNWTTLHVSDRKECLYFLYDSRDKPRFLEVVQYVLHHYPDCDIEDLEGEVNLLLILPTHLALKVVRFNCSRGLTLQHVPGLMRKGIPPQKLEKLLRASQEGGGRKRRKGVLQTLKSIPEGQTGFDDTPENVEQGAASGQLCADGPQQHELSLQLQSYQLKLTMTSDDVKAYIESVLDETYRKSCRHLDSYVQRMLSLCESHVNLNEVSTSHGTLLHSSAKFGLAESAREILAQGYCNMLLENDGDQPNTWPLVYAVRHNHWSTVKVLLETLSTSGIAQSNNDSKITNLDCLQLYISLFLTSQSKTQIRVLLQTIDYKDILQQLSDYSRPWWLCRRFQHGDLKEKLQNEGRLLLLSSVLDTMVKGCEVDPALFFDDETDDITSNPGGGRTVNGAESGNTRHTDQQDGVNVIETEKEKRSLYRLISESDVEELKCHPSFAAIVQHKWKQNYYFVWHGVLFGIYIAFIVLFTMAFILAAQSSDPRSYTSPRDFVRLFVLEITCLLYILVVLVGDSILFIDEVRNHVHSRKKIFDLLIEKMRWNFLFELLRYLSIFLIIVLRIANDPHQWWMVCLAIILCGLRIFHYATVLPFMGKYVGTLILIAKHDLPRLVAVFLVINFSFGTGLYFALVDHSNDDDVHVANTNSTSEVYNLWLTGVQMVIEGSVLTYVGRDGFNIPGQIVYWLFVFCVTVAFAAILIAQFETSFNTLSNKAKMNVILKKLEIMRKMERFHDVFGRVFRKVPFVTLTHGNETDSEESDESQKSVRRTAWDDLENLDVKDYIVSKLSRKLAENDKRVQALEIKMEKMYNLLLSMKKK